MEPDRSRVEVEGRKIDIRHTSPLNGFYPI